MRASSRFWLISLVLVAACASGGKDMPDGSTTGAADASTVDGCTPDPAGESCNGKDDDCDGKVDETFTQLGMTCTAGQGACMHSGHYACSSDHTATVCDTGPGMPGNETCNGMDDDCDGMIDEGFMLGMPCDGADADLCTDGVYICDGTGGVACTDDA